MNRMILVAIVVLAGCMSTATPTGTVESTPSMTVAAIPTSTLAPDPSDESGTHAVLSGETIQIMAVDLGVSDRQRRYWDYDKYPSLSSIPQIVVGWVLTTDGPPMPTPAPIPLPTRLPGTANPNSTPKPGGGSSWTQLDYQTAAAWSDAAIQTYLAVASMALVRQPDSDDWQATAAGPLDGQTVHGRGGQPERALPRLADELRRIRGRATG